MSLGYFHSFIHIVFSIILKLNICSLAGKCNRVYTGVVLKHAKGTQSFTEMADVYFGNITQEQIEAYVESGDPM